jgi:hypothetical protein
MRIIFFKFLISIILAFQLFVQPIRAYQKYADGAVNTYQAVTAAGDAFGKGDYVGGTINTAFALLGAKGISESAKGLGNLDELRGGKAITNAIEEGSDEIGSIKKALNADEVKGKGYKTASDYLDDAKQQKVGGEINERLQSKLDAWKSYKAKGGEMDMKRWGQATQKQYGNPNRHGEGYGKWAKQQEKGVHGNSLDADGLHDVYVIRQKVTDQVLHFGETGRGYLTRGEEWRKKLNNEFGLDTYVELLKTVDGKRAAKVLETKYIKTYEKIFGNKPGFTDASGVFNQIQKTEH